MTPGDRRFAVRAPSQPAMPDVATMAAATRSLIEMGMSVMAPRCFAAKGPAGAKSPCRQALLSWERQLDLEGVVDLDGLTAQQRRCVPAMLERLDHSAVHERQALDDPAIAHD